MGKSGLVDKVTWIIGICAFFLSLIFDISTIIIIIAAGIVAIVYKNVKRRAKKEGK